MKPESSIKGRLKGRVRFVRDGQVLFEGHNEITDFGEEPFIRGLLAGDPDYFVWTIVVGEGGDCEISPPHNDTGGRVAPDPSETEVRKVVEGLPIQATSTNIDGSITYKALARREQANSPNINELGLFTRGGDMVAHFVTEVDIGGRAKKYPKTELMFDIIEWTLTYTGA